jgi:hypothetical protein
LEVRRIQVDEELVRSLFLSFKDRGSLLKSSFEGQDFMGMDWEGDSEDSFLDTPALEPRIKQNVCKTDFLSKNIGAFDVFLHEFENVRDVGFHFLLFFLIFGEEQID